MSRAIVRAMENEFRMWCVLSSEARTLHRTDPEASRLDDYRDEAEVIAMYTEWPMLKARIASELTTYPTEQAQGEEPYCTPLLLG